LKNKKRITKGISPYFAFSPGLIPQEFFFYNESFQDIFEAASTRCTEVEAHKSHFTFKNLPVTGMGLFINNDFLSIVSDMICQMSNGHFEVVTSYLLAGKNLKKIQLVPKLL